MRTSVVLALFALASVVACSGTSVPQGFGSGGNGSGSGGSGSGGSGSGGSGSGGGSSSGVNLGGSSSGGSSGGSTGDAGFVCAPNPANYDIPGNGCDDDGNGTVDDVVVCDQSLPTTGTATQILNAMGICQNADSTHWGIVSATFTNGHTQTGPGASNFAEQHGILTAFGPVNPQEGKAFGVLSSGSATVQDSDTGPWFKGEKKGMQGPPGILTGNGGDVPAGFPKQTTGCPAIADGVNDVIDVKVQIKVPANAKGFSFDFNFYSAEWPEYVCNSYNDSFIAYLTSKAFNSGNPDNISFDSKGNPISVNANFFQVCTPGVETGCAGGTTATSTCTLGPAALASTGFGSETPAVNYCAGGGGGGGGGGGAPSTSGGSTSWLTSTAPLQAAETMSIEFLIWDTGDASWDSSVLMDHWVWQPQEVPATPVTQPSPPPK